jgi:hypothetical protein
MKFWPFALMALWVFGLLLAISNTGPFVKQLGHAMQGMAMGAAFVKGGLW